MVTGLGVLAILAMMSLAFLHRLDRESRAPEAVRNPEAVVRVCAYCNLIMGVHSSAIKGGYLSTSAGQAPNGPGTMLTHGICPGCYEKMIKELDGEKTSRTNHINLHC